MELINPRENQNDRNFIIRYESDELIANFYVWEKGVFSYEMGFLPSDEIISIGGDFNKLSDLEKYFFDFKSDLIEKIQRQQNIDS